MVGKFDGLAFGLAATLAFGRAFRSTSGEQLKLLETAEEFGSDESAHEINATGVEAQRSENDADGQRSPKANNVNSRGCQPTEDVETNIDPAGVKQFCVLLRQILFIELNAVFDQKFPQLVFERNLLVMFLLVLDVCDHGIPVAVRQGECPVAVLPMAEFRKDVLLLNPCAGSNFDVLHQV